jgi:tRNA (adenine22-N1)-methyltransferase
MLKLGKRLQQLNAMAGSQYDHIWDCCCDHGLLGTALLVRQAAPWIHFVDRVPALMQTLETTLNRFHPASINADTNTDANANVEAARWQTHCIDVAALPLSRFRGRQLVIIAGVGGDLMAHFVEAIAHYNPECEFDMLLCPVHHEFTLRQQLIHQGFSLVDETLVKENRRCYPLIFVSRRHHRGQTLTPLSPVGSMIWKTESAELQRIAAEYLQQTIAHYRRMQLNPKVDVAEIIEAYNAVSLS